MAGISRMTVEQVLEMISDDEIDLGMDVEVGKDSDSSDDEATGDISDDLIDEFQNDEDHSSESEIDKANGEGGATTSGRSALGQWRSRGRGRGTGNQELAKTYNWTAVGAGM